MKPRLPTVKQEAFAVAMYTIGSLSLGNGTESARKAEYKGNDNVLATTAHALIRKPKIIKLKEQIQAETEEKLNLSREAQHKKLQQALAMAIETKSAAAMTSAIREQNEMLGYHRDKAPNTEREAARLARMSDEERKLAELAAKLRTEAESKVKTIPFPVSKRA